MVTRMSGEPVLACDVGGTRLRVAVVDPDGSVHSKEVIPTPPDDPGALTRVMRVVLDRAGRTIPGAVVGVPGAIDYTKGEALKLPNLPHWEGHVSAGRLSAELGLPVLLVNDADLAALGEHRYGAGQGARDMVYVTSSTGVGAGVILNGRLVHGRLSLAEVGFTIIDRATHGTVEELGSGTALARLSGEDPISIVARAKSGDSEALLQFAGVAEAFAMGVTNLIHCFSPETVVIGGGMSQAGDLLLDPIRKMLTECPANCTVPRPNVVRAEAGDDVGLRGAAAYWADYQAK